MRFRRWRGGILYRAAIKADPGDAIAHALGFLPQNERKDIDGAEAAYRAAIEIRPGDVDAHATLGALLENKRKNIGGAGAWS